MTDWERVDEGQSHSGYVAWETALATAAGTAGQDHLPVFATLRPGGEVTTLVQAIDATLALPGVRLARHERDLLATERALAGATGWPHEVRVVAYVPRARMDRLPPFWEVQMVGPPVHLSRALAQGPGRNLCAMAGDLDPAVPVAAVIDDGIGFLNARFRAAPGRTRIRAIWLQAPEELDSADVLCGRVLDQAAIDADLASPGDEAGIYRRINRSLLPVTDAALTDRRVAHGTHVLDLAAGAALAGGDPVGQTPILAVQLPPASIRETAGRRLETHLIQGLRWLLAEALAQARGTDVPPVVVTISLGSLAGPGNPQAPVADWLRHELDRHARLTGGAPVRLVMAYGNARMARLVARAEARRAQPMQLLWRVQPDDLTSSFLELRADTDVAGGLTLDLVPPVGSGLPPLSVAWPAPGQGWRLPGPRAAVTAWAEPGGQTLLHLALAPTAGDGAHSAAGAWHLTLRPTEAEPVRLTARVQRDDTPAGHRAFGRQSWLDHPLGWDWDEDLRGYLAPRPAADAPGCPITREGTHVAYAGAGDARILFVGAARPVPGQPGRMRPAIYSAEGTGHLAQPGESAGPTLVAPGDQGTWTSGMLAAGVVSGSVARLSGTSMAAPQVARALLRYFLTVPAGAQSPQAERSALTGSPDWGAPDRRMGAGPLRGALTA